jgi:hypothetical protein
MKKITTLFLSTLIIMFLLSLASCKKSEQPTDEEILNEAINKVIPQKYLDTLKNLGLLINEGINPPNIEGIYFVTPHILAKSNIPNDYQIGFQFLDSKLKLSKQNNANFGIEVLGKNYIAPNDTSVVTAISGNANNFTVYGKVKSTHANGVDYVIFGLIISGIKEGNYIKNLKTGIINIDESHAGTTGWFILEGQARIVYDQDKSSEPISVFKGSLETNGYKTMGAKK